MPDESKDETKMVIQCPYCPKKMIESSLKGHMVDEHWDTIKNAAVMAASTDQEPNQSSQTQPAPGPQMLGPSTEVIDLKDRINTLELAVNKLIELASSGRSQEGAEAPGPEAAPGAGQQGGLALGLISKMLAPEDPFARLAYRSMEQGMLMQQAMTLGILRGMGMKIGKKALDRFGKALEGEEGIHVVTGEE